MTSLMIFFFKNYFFLFISNETQGNAIQTEDASEFQ